MKNFMFYLSILMISNIYAESITIYATQSASYRASGSGSSGCCSLNSIGYNNSNTLSASSCTWWSQYGQCERRTSYPIWSFNFLELPSNATVVSVYFDAEGLYDEWHDSYMALSSETGEITIQMGSYLVNGGDWSIDGQTWTWWNQGLNINQELPVSEVELGIDSGQLNVAVHEYSATIINSGLNAPRLVIEYELLDYECSEMDEMECSSDDSCDWVENIEYGNCNNLGSSACDANPNCWGAYTNPGWYYGWYCAGGSYQIDNSYCEENEMPECSEMNQLPCVNDDSCEWVEDIGYGTCSDFGISSSCNAATGCYWYCDSTYTWLCWCNGGNYEIDNSYCEEVSSIPGDTNGDGSLNVSDIVLIVDLILSSEYDEYSDMNQDGTLNIMDIIELVNRILDR